MNIVFLSREYPPALHGGIGTYTYVTAPALAKAGHQVDVIAWTEGEERVVQEGPVRVHWIRSHLVRPLCQRPLRWLRLYHRFPVVGEWLGWSYAAYRRVRELHRQKPVDVIEAHENAAPGYASSFSRRIPLAVKFHLPRCIGYEQRGEELREDVRLGFQFEKWAAKRATLMTSPSRALAGLLSQRWGFDPGQVTIVPYAVDEGWFRPSGNPGCGLGQDPVVLYVGSLGKTKGTRVLLDAFARLLAVVPTARLRLIGHLRSDRDIDEPTYQDYILHRLGLHVAARVEFVGRLGHRQLVHEYQACAISTVPSVLFDNHPNTCLEAMACGRPVVGSDSGGIPEIIQDRVTGLIVPAGDPEALADALAKLLLDRPRAEQMGVAGRRRVEDTYARSVVMSRQVEAYLEARRRFHA